MNTGITSERSISPTTSVSADILVKNPEAEIDMKFILSHEKFEDLFVSAIEKLLNDELNLSESDWVNITGRTSKEKATYIYEQWKNAPVQVDKVAELKVQLSEAETIRYRLSNICELSDECNSLDDVRDMLSNQYDIAVTTCYNLNKLFKKINK